MKTPISYRILFHYTCRDHGADGIRRLGYVGTNPHPLLPGQPSLVWLTDLSEPIREGLGLTSSLLSCDRTEVRVAVNAPTAVPWTLWARANYVPRSVRDDLESFGLPAHWWVSERRCSVVAIDDIAAFGAAS